MDQDTELSVALAISSEVHFSGEKEKHYTETDGKLYKRGDVTYLQYKEEIEGAGSVNNVIKITNAGILIIRSGSVSMKQKYLIGQTTKGMYDSPYGQLWMETTTHEMNFRWNQQNQTGDLKLAYELVLQGEHTGTHRIKINFQEAKA
jgi:uncharacterized beta-barrel protein YwiB (DUF1934 family)